MRKSNKFLIIIFLFVFTSWAKEKKTEMSDINSFLESLNEISLPFSTEYLPRAQKVSNDFFIMKKEIIIMN